MTVEDKLSLRGQLLAEIEKAEEDFIYQREKAFRLVKGLREIANRIDVNARLEPSGEDFGIDAGLEIGLSSQDQSSLDYNVAVAMLVDLKKSRQELCNLRLRNSLMNRRSAINTL